MVNDNHLFSVTCWNVLWRMVRNIKYVMTEENFIILTLRKETEKVTHRLIRFMAVKPATDVLIKQSAYINMMLKKTEKNKIMKINEKWE